MVLAFAFKKLDLRAAVDRVSSAA